MGKFKSKSKSNTKRQKLYKMKGCSKQNRKSKSKSKSKKSKTKKYRGGNENTNNLERAFPNTGPVMLEGELGTPFLNSQGNQRGGNCGCGLPAMSGGGNGTGFVGQPWSGSPSDWPGVDGVANNRNYLAQNNYHTDPQTDMISTGAQPPFLGGRKNKKRQKGGSFSNFLAQDVINFGRQFQHGLGTTYNALAGYPSPVSPLPWKDQMTANRPLK